MATHAARQAQPDQTDVAIIGCGPVGALLANLLGLQGIATIVFEREAAIYHLPRAVHFDDEIMRVLQTVDLADKMTPLVHLSPGMKFIDDTGRLLLAWPRPMQVGPQGWHASYRFHQPELERVLRDGLARFPSVSLRYRTEVFALDQQDDAVAVRYEDLSTGGLATCRARYVVGCDGGRSLVRRLMGAQMDDLGFHERWLVVDVILNRPRPDLGDFSVQYCSKQRSATYVRGTGDRRRWEMLMHPGEDAAAMTQPARVRELLQPWLAPDDAEVERAAVYTFHSAVAPIWRERRLLIAGDSAHMTPPFLGQGMCAGLRDAANLGWKLGRVLRALNDDALLDTYQSERDPHVREYIELAVRLGGLINTKAMDAAVPDSVLDGGEAAQMRSIKPRLGPGLAPEWNGLARQLAPQPRLAGGKLLDDEVGYRFAAIMRRNFADSVPGDTLRRLADRDVAIVADGSAEPNAWLQSSGASAVVVRPDRYVLGAVHSVQDLHALAAAI